MQVGSECSNGRYVGRISKTQSGLKCVPWNRLNRTLHTITPDRLVPQTLEHILMMELQNLTLDERTINLVISL